MSDVKNSNRIIFVEPNDVYEASGGKSLTPPYEDFCIAFNLYVENYPRFRSNLQSSATRDRSDERKSTPTLSWFYDKKKTDVSFMAGSTFGSADGTNYLTTYYTDISFGNYGDQDQVERRIVEGLGVESVQIGFESWYGQVVTVKFVDVRGSALFGNEEAIHDNNKITANNIFGSFFTFPYPKFHLQVKGFLGKPVTYQLACKSFTGEYNSETGNYEAIAQFVGYTYSLLTDIPIDYLVAAPYCPYIGRSYWNEHVNSEEWALDDGTPPLRMDEFFRRVENAQKDPSIKEATATDVENDRLKEIQKEKDALYKVRNGYDNFYAAFADASVGKFEYSDGEQLQTLFFFESGSSQNKITDNVLKILPYGDVQQSFKDMSEALSDYNDTFPSSTISRNNLPNSWKECPSSIEAPKLLSIERDSTTNAITKVSIVGLDGKSRTTANIKALKLNDNRQMCDRVASSVYHGTLPPHFSKQLGTYAFLVDFYALESMIKSKLDALEKERVKIVQGVEDRNSSRIKDIVGFKPYIGNVFKMIMCHLETYIHIIMDASDEMLSQAKEGKRTPSYLKVGIENTDVVNLGPNGSLPPWPLVMNQGVALEDGGEITDTDTQIAWVGDFSHNFLEEEVILGLQSAVRRIVDNAPNTSTHKEYTMLPIMPCDLSDSLTPYARIAGSTDISSLAGFVSMRAAQVLGVLNGSSVGTTMVKLLGKMDAYNYINGGDSVKDIRDNIFSKAGSGSVSDVLAGIAKCVSDYDMYGVTSQNSGKTYHKFETEKRIMYNDADREPIVTVSGGKCQFTRWYDSRENALIPYPLRPFERCKETFDYTMDADYTKCYFTPKFNEFGEHDWLYRTDSRRLITDEDYEEKYVNERMFRIIDGESEVGGIDDLHDKLKESGFKVGEYTVDDDFTSFLNTYWKTDGERFYKYFSSAKRMLSPRRSEYSISNSEMLPASESGDAPSTFTYNAWIEQNGKNIHTNEEGAWFIDDRETSSNSLCMQEFLVYETSSSAIGNLFGHPFYYMQNNISDEATRLKVKALLFLHTFRYDYSNVLNVFLSTKKNGTLECVPKVFLLLLGGLLWRRRKGAADRKDPIIYSEGAYSYKTANSGTLERTLFVKEKGKYYQFYTIKSGSKLDYNVSVASLFGGKDSDAPSTWVPDLNITNQLIAYFEEFATKRFNVIAEQCELRRKDTDADFKYSTFLAFVKGLSTKIYSNSSSASDAFDYIKENVRNWAGKYRIMTVTDKNNPCMLTMLMEENETMQSTFWELYRNKVIVADSCYRRMRNKAASDEATGDDTITFSESLYKDYVSSFVGQLKKFVDGLADDSSEDSTAGSDQLKKNRDYSISMYLYVKSLWDKWLLSADENQFDVDVFFKKNFFFIDSYYRNAYSKLPINCSTLLDRYTNSPNVTMADDNCQTLYSFMNHIISDNRCIFFSLPDYVGFNGKEADVKTMKNLFKAIPFNEIGAPELDNKFVIVYTNKPSEVSDIDDNYRYDGFDIWSVSNGTDQALPIFKSTNAEPKVDSSGKTVSDERKETDTSSTRKADEKATRMGYNVPSFGVAVNRQNNHVFKKIRWSMKNPVVTDQSIRAYSNILKLGKSGERRVAFHGQDIYPIYSSYSYSCEITMIGDAQICPLMYFQLLNMPMARGTYMIYKVTHTMTPGNMETVFTGMKMSSRPMPFGSTFFATMGEKPSSEGSSTYGSGDTYEDSMTDNVYAKVTEPKGDYYHDKSYQNSVSHPDTLGSVSIDPQLVKLFNQLVEEIRLLPENQPKDAWNICLSSAVRSGSGSSDHYSGHAIDVKVMRYNKDGKFSKYCKANQDNQRELGKVVDILYCNHRAIVRQCILEYVDARTFMCPVDKKYQYNVLHIASVHTSDENKHDFFIGKKSGPVINGTDKDWFPKYVPAEFKSVAARSYYGDNDFFRKYFLNYARLKGMTDDDYNAHFKDCGSTVDGVTTAKDNPSANGRIKQAVQWLQQYYSKEVAIGICANLCRESGGSEISDKKTLVASINESSGGVGEGIAQWTTADRKKMVRDYLNGKYSPNAAKKITDFNMTQQLDAIDYEMTHLGMLTQCGGKNMGLKKMLVNATSAENAAWLFVTYYERPSSKVSYNTINNNLIAKIRRIVY